MNKFKDEIWRLAIMKFGVISDKIEERVNAETDCIQEHGRTEMLQTMWRLVKELRKQDINVTLAPGDGYNVSLVCYLLGISTFNPMNHPELITESYVKSTFKSSSEMTFKIDKDETEAIDKFFDSQKFEIERKDIPGAYHSRRVKTSRDSDFTLEFKHVCNSGRIRIIGDLIGWDRFERIPNNDSETMKLIQEIDIYGTTTSFLAPITIETIRQIKPSNVSELADAMSFTSERKSSHLLKYLENRDAGNRTFTGHPRIDEILSPTHGLLLYTNQYAQIWDFPLRRESGENAYNIIKEKYNSLMVSPLVNRCDMYVKAYNLYRLAYAKAHFPDKSNHHLIQLKSPIFHP